jgi:hypothetical protein
MRGRRWIQEEDEFLKENYKTMSYREMSLKLNRTHEAITKRCAKLGFAIKHPIVVGERFYKLVVIKRSEKKEKGNLSFYECKCDCGKTSMVRGSALRSGQTRSCGCYKKEANEKNRLPVGEASLNSLETIYKRGAKRRGIYYALSREEFRYLVSQDCHWCGERPKSYNPYYNRKTNEKKIGITDNWAKKQEIFINGIDRVDNNIGYVLNNCVPCCTKCNEMKMDKTVSEFLNHIHKIINFQENKKEDK